jgi:ech hydrogenase subunit C
VTGPAELVHRWIRRSRTKSPWLVHFDCGGCNGCDIEVLDTLTPRHSAERFGVINVGDPRQGDVLVVTGPANCRNAAVLQSLYDQMAEPKAVVAVGSCAAHGGIFRGSPNILGGVGEVIPVDVFVSGCPPRPERILDGVLAAAPLLAEPRAERAATGGPGRRSSVTSAARAPLVVSGEAEGPPGRPVAAVDVDVRGPDAPAGTRAERLEEGS